MHASDIGLRAVVFCMHRWIEYSMSASLMLCKAAPHQTKVHLGTRSITVGDLVWQL